MRTRVSSFFVAAALAAAPVVAQAAEASGGPVARQKIVRAQGGAGACPAGVFVAAERGDPRAQAQVGFMYQTGRCVPQGWYMAALWYGRAAAQGHPGAQYQLGLLYDKGMGVPQNYLLAHMWLNLATAASAPERIRDSSARMRDAVATKMSDKALGDAQYLAVHWVPVPER